MQQHHLPDEILKKIKWLEISTRKLVQNLLAGEYKTAFRGQGITFSEFREYSPGDDVRAISWPLTARTGKPYIKRFEEEREHTILLAVDVSASGLFGTRRYLKGEAMTHLAAALGFAAVKNQDSIGLILFSDRVEHFVKPKKGRPQIFRILRDLYYFKPFSRRSNIEPLAHHLLGVLKKKSTIFIFSDFLDFDFESSLRRLSRRHEVIAVVVEDPADLHLPAMGLLDIQDPETDEIITIDTSSPSFQKDFLQLSKMRVQKRIGVFKKANIESISITTKDDVLEPLIAYFKKRRT